jgi:ribosomal protein S18 acetylase RimI-like enzyme
VHIRPFHAEDEPAVVALWEQCHLTRPWNDPHKDIARKLKIQPELFLVGAENGAIVATVMAGYEGHRGWVNYLAVAPAFRGRGFGRALMDRVEQVLLGMGCPKVSLLIRSANADVVEFYRHIGYAQDEVVTLGKRLIHDRPTAA